ncbi:MAG: PD-(D/E)XK nuclease family protein [Vagococcus sp.]
MKKKKPVDITDSISLLKESPLFQLSLSSRELFHSNFLYWLLTNYNEESTALFASYINTNSPLKIVSVSREEKNIDLTVTFKNENKEEVKLYIENKVKSIPYKEQLEKYVAKLKEGSFLLLSLSKPNQEILEDMKWSVMDYRELSQRLSSIKMNMKNNYHQSLMEDYIEFISLLQDLADNITNQEFRVYDIYSGNSVMNQLKEIRVDDLFIKLKHQEMVDKIRIQANKSIELGNLSSDKLVLQQAYTRGTGITDTRYWIKISDKKQIGFAVQLQELSFKLMIETVGFTAEKIAQDLLKNNLWFDFGLLTEAKINETDVIYPTTKNKLFNKYGPNHLYKSMKIKKNCSVDDLVSLMTSYLVKSHNNREKVLELVDSY